MVTSDELIAIRDRHFCDDVMLTNDMLAWTSEQAEAFFESGGVEWPSDVPLMKPLLQSRLISRSRSNRSSTESMGSSSLVSSPPASPTICASAASPDQWQDSYSGKTQQPTWVMIRACQEAVALASAMPPELSTKMVEELCRMGESLFARGAYEEACASYDAALKLAPNEAHIAHASELAHEAARGGVWLRQILPGRDVALTPTSSSQQNLVFGAAAHMKNLMYLVGDATSRECYAIDACWDTDGLVAYCEKHKMRLVGAICTHAHFDHSGGVVPPALVAMVYGPLAMGRFDGHTVPGLREMGREHACRLYCHAAERETIAKQCGLELHELISLHAQSTLPLGSAGALEVIHTPGHSSGSICIGVHEAVAAETAPTAPSARRPAVASRRWRCLFVGDTIFPGACGRLDLPDCDKSAMYESLRTLATLDEALVVYPGHAFSGECTTIGQEKRAGLLRHLTKKQWLDVHAVGDETTNETPAASKTPYFVLPAP